MAEGLLRRLAPDRFDVFSAGTRPGFVHPLAIEVMARIGINISSHRSQSVSEFSGQLFDYIITVCDRAKDECPLFPGKAQRIHWDIPDPAGVEGSNEEILLAFSKVRDDLKERIIDFCASVPE